MASFVKVLSYDQQYIYKQRQLLHLSLGKTTFLVFQDSFVTHE